MKINKQVLTMVFLILLLFSSFSGGCQINSPSFITARANPQIVTVMQGEKTDSIIIITTCKINATVVQVLVANVKSPYAPHATINSSLNISVEINENNPVSLPITITTDWNTEVGEWLIRIYYYELEENTTPKDYITITVIVERNYVYITMIVTVTVLIVGIVTIAGWKIIKRKKKI